MIQVWTGSHDGHQASGVLDRNGASGSTFACTPPPPPRRQLCDERCAGGLAVTPCYTTKWDVIHRFSAFHWFLNTCRRNNR
jgi:hypothetical protein